MAAVTLAELGKLRAGAAAVQGAASFWTPEAVNTVINGIKDLLKAYNEMRQGAAGIATAPAAAQAPGPGDARADTPGQGQQVTQGQAVTMPQLAAMAKRIFESLEAKGYADKTPFEALQSVTLTIGQIKGFLP